MTFKCIHRTKKRIQTWQGNIEIISCSGRHIEASITGKGTYFHVITGPHRYGKYICVPNHNLGSELASYEDYFWNKEKLSQIIGMTDATTIASGLTHLPEILENQIYSEE